MVAMDSKSLNLVHGHTRTFCLLSLAASEYAPNILAPVPDTQPTPPTGTPGGTDRGDTKFCRKTYFSALTAWRANSYISGCLGGHFWADASLIADCVTSARDHGGVY